MLQLWFNCGKYKCGQLLKKGECNLHEKVDGFGGLVVSMLASGTQVCGFKPGRSRWIFTDVKILSMPSFGGEEK